MEIEAFKKQLLARQSELQALSKEAAEGCETVQLDQSCVGRLSRMDAMQSQAMNQAGQRRREQELLQITVALNRVENGEFGECSHCGEVISEGRLRIDPTSLLCIACAEAQE